MIGTKLLRGQGLGNQLFCYVTTRCIALKRGLDFAILGGETLANNMHSDCGMYFMDIDLGIDAKEEDFTQTYEEKEDRLFLGNSRHDLEHGCYVAGTDQEMFQVPDGTLLMGNMQAEDYFLPYKGQIREWLKVKKEYDCYEYSRDNLCILHLRCTDYMGSAELYVRKKYWLDGMKAMKRQRPDMEFMIITNDVAEARKFLPQVPAYNFDLAKDYAILKNARYLLLANSSFAYFPAFTSERVRYILAPKYWARHNVSKGYWTSEQNIYQGWHYMDRKGRVFSAEECRRELEAYKKRSPLYKRLNRRPSKPRRFFATLRYRFIYGKARMERIGRGVGRRLKKALGKGK